MKGDWIHALNTLKANYPMLRAAIHMDADHVKVSVSTVLMGGRVAACTHVITASECEDIMPPFDPVLFHLARCAAEVCAYPDKHVHKLEIVA